MWTSDVWSHHSEKITFHPNSVSVGQQEKLGCSQMCQLIGTELTCWCFVGRQSKAAILCCLGCINRMTWLLWFQEELTMDHGALTARNQMQRSVIKLQPVAQLGTITHYIYSVAFTERTPFIITQAFPLFLSIRCVKMSLWHDLRLTSAQIVVCMELILRVFHLFLLLSTGFKIASSSASPSEVRLRSWSFESSVFKQREIKHAG